MKVFKIWETKVAKDKKGFTLIEIIVVLIILAILAAFTLPAMLGFVREARGKAYITEARVGIVAAQAVVTEAIASGNATPTTSAITTNQTFINMTADVNGEFSNFEIEGATSGGINRVTGLEYRPDDTNYVITIDDGSTSVTTE